MRPFWKRRPAALPAEWLVAGLGNPGAEYRGTRHNVGFDCIDLLAEGAALAPRSFRLERKSLRASIELEGRRVVLAKPQLYMNLSGEGVRELLRVEGLKPDRLIVILDEMSLPPGRLRVRRDGSAGGHNGLKSLIEKLQTDAFCRVRIGVGRPPGSEDPARWVLSRPAPADRELISVATARAADAVREVIAHGVEAAMNRFNAPGAG